MTLLAKHYGGIVVVQRVIISAKTFIWPLPPSRLLPASLLRAVPTFLRSVEAFRPVRREQHAGAPCCLCSRNPLHLWLLRVGFFHPLKHSVANCNVHSLSLHRKPLTVCKFFGSLYSHFYSATNMPLMSVILQL